MSKQPRSETRCDRCKHWGPCNGTGMKNFQGLAHVGFVPLSTGRTMGMCSVAHEVEWGKDGSDTPEQSRRYGQTSKSRPWSETLNIGPLGYCYTFERGTPTREADGK